MSSMVRDPAQLQRYVGWDRATATDPAERERLHSYIAFQMASAGLLPPQDEVQANSMAAFSTGILQSLQEKNRLLTEHRAPVDRRIETFLNSYFHDDVGDHPVRLPSRSLTLDRHGMARELSLPVNGDHYKNDLVQSHRCLNGVLNNPLADRRTTAGTFHIAEGGLPIPGEKRAVPKHVFVNLFRAAMAP